LLEQSFLKSIFGNFFDFLKTIAQSSKKFATSNYNSFRKEAAGEVSSVKEYFAWLNEFLPLEEEELYYIPEDDIEPGDFKEEDFISPFVYAISSIKKFGDLFTEREKEWNSEIISDSSKIFEAILCSTIMDSRSNRGVYKNLIDNKIEISEISPVIFDQKYLEKGSQSSKEFQKVIASFFSYIALFAKTLEYINEASRCARKLDNLFANDKNLNFLSRQGYDRFRSNMQECFRFANSLSTSLHPISNSIRNKMPPGYGNFDMSEDEWATAKENIPEEFWEIDARIQEKMFSMEEEADKVREKILKFINMFSDAFLYNDIEYEIQDYCDLESEICEKHLSRLEYEEELREKRGAGEEAQYLVDIVNDLSKEISDKEKEILRFKKSYSASIKERKVLRGLISNLLIENLCNKR